MIDRRRRALALAALAALAPRGAAAQGSVRTVGYLSNGADATHLSKALAKHGYIEGRNLRIVLRVRNERPLDELAAEILAAKPSVLVAWGRGNVGAFARLTRTIPIVCAETSDPVEAGFAQSLRRPGGNITGLSAGVPEMAPILVGLLHAVRPKLRRCVAIVDGEGESAREGWGRVLRVLGEEAAKLRVQWEIRPVPSLDAFEGGIVTMDPETSALYIVRIPESPEPGRFIEALQRRKLANLSARPDLVRIGALMHYSIHHADVPGRVAAMIAKLLGGADPAEMPFDLPDRTTFLVNRGTARAIGVELPAQVLARATEIID